MSDVSPYGVTQNPNAELVTANALVGERVSPVVGNSLVGSASMFSTAPYKPPRSKRVTCRGKGGACQAYPIRGADLCVFHTPDDTHDEAS
jgi:hypothetical protein